MEHNPVFISAQDFLKKSSLLSDSLQAHIIFTIRNRFSFWKHIGKLCGKSTILKTGYACDAKLIGKNMEKKTKLDNFR